MSPLFRTSALGLACALGALACSKGGTNGNQPPPPPPTGTGGSAGTGISTGTGGQPPPPPPPSGMVVITIQQPMAGLVAPAGSLVPVTITAAVDQGTDVIEPSSVMATVTAKGDSATVDSTMLAAQGMDIYTGRLSIGDRPTGDYTLTISATSSGGMKNTASLDFQIDGGPSLFVRTPQPLHSYKDLLVIEVVADPGPFGPLMGPYATVANYPVELDPVSGADNTYRGTIDLNNPAPGMVVPQLVDQQLLTVWAINANGKRVDIHLVFVIDETGPTITKTLPAPGDIVGDIMTISATISDPAGVLDSSVIAVIGDDTTPAKFNVQLKPDGLGAYSVLFDTRQLTGCPDPPVASDKCIVYPTISFRASDELGNESVVGYDFTVDNIAPVADLDPPNLRSYLLLDRVRCSYEFDPLSNNSLPGDMPNDKNQVPQVFDLRARIEDDGNHAPGLKQTPISLVDPDKTAVYVLDDETQALIVDTDGDGWCDSINPLLTPTTEPPTNNNQVLKIRLAPVMPAGTANFLPDSTLPEPFCDQGIAGTLPPLLCGGNQPTIAIGYTTDAKQPAIWTLEDIDPNWCFGRPFDTAANNITDMSWACIAVQTTDMANNTGVSAPLRVYVNQRNPVKPGTIGPGTPPACTGIYDRTTNTVTNGPCKTRRFERQPDSSDKYCYDRACPGPFLPL
jgi:hypothetical protein